MIKTLAPVIPLPVEVDPYSPEGMARRLADAISSVLGAGPGFWRYQPLEDQPAWRRACALLAPAPGTVTSDGTHCLGCGAPIDGGPYCPACREELRNGKTPGACALPERGPL